MRCKGRSWGLSGKRWHEAGENVMRCSLIRNSDTFFFRVIKSKRINVGGA